MSTLPPGYAIRVHLTEDGYEGTCPQFPDVAVYESTAAKAYVSTVNVVLDCIQIMGERK